MSRRIAIAAALLLTMVAQPALADFGRVASGLRSLGFERTWIPFLGLARVAVRVVQPKGVHDFQLAVYEKTPQVSSAQLERMVTSRLARGFSPLVRVRSNRNGESVFIYAKPSRNGRVVELLILAREREETVLVRVVADAEVVGRELVEPQRVRFIASR